MLLILAGILAIALVGGILILIFRLLPVSSDVHKILTGLTMFCVGVAYLAWMIYVAIRYSLVFSLAAARIKSPIKMSARLTEGNIWRLFWNGLVLYLIFVPVFLFTLVLFLGTGAMASGNILIGIVLAADYVALLLLIGGFFASFFATVCRILYQEKRQSDPSFVLETRA